MKRFVTIILTLFQCATLSACIGGVSGDTINYDTNEAVQVGEYSIWVTIPDGWEECETENFDLQCISPKRDMYLSTYGFSKIDLSADLSVEGLFELQNDEVLSLRNNVSEVEPTSLEDNDEKSIYSALYSGEKNGVKNYYQFFLIEFKSTDDMVWVLFTGMPSDIEKNRDTIDEIVSTIQNSEPERVCDSIDISPSLLTDITIMRNLMNIAKSVNERQERIA